MDVLIAALIEMAEPLRLAMLVLGVLLGLMVGVIPGIGGIFGLTILIPITYGLTRFQPLRCCWAWPRSPRRRTRSRRC